MLSTNRAIRPTRLMAQKGHVASTHRIPYCADIRTHPPEVQTNMPTALLVIFLLFFAVLAFAWFYVQRAKARDATPVASTDAAVATSETAAPAASTHTASDDAGHDHSDHAGHDHSDEAVHDHSDPDHQH